MSRLPSLKPAEVVRALERAGFRQLRQRGSHRFMVTGSRAAIVPMHSREMKRGTLHRILRDAGLDVEEFLKLL